MSTANTLVQLNATSLAAYDAVQLRGNKSLSVQHGDPGRQCPLRINLTFQALAGRQCILFGSSQRCHFRLPQDTDVAYEQFAIHIERHTGSVLITDLSVAGTCLTSLIPPAAQRLHGSTWPLLPDMHISFGARGRFGFLCRLPQPASEAGMRAYALSVGRPAPSLLDRPTIPCIQPPVFFGHGLLALRLLSENSQSCAYCLRTRDGRVFAVKKMIHQQDLTTDVKCTGAVRLLRSIRHPNILPFLDVLQAPGASFLVMEFLPSGSLADLWKRRRAAPMEVSTVRLLYKQCLYGIRYIHHRGMSLQSLCAATVFVLREEPLRIKLLGVCSVVIGEDDAQSRRARGKDIVQTARLAVEALGLDPTAISHGATGPSMSPCQVSTTLATLACGPALLPVLREHDLDRMPSADDLLRDTWLTAPIKRKRCASFTWPGNTVKRRRLQADGEVTLSSDIRTKEVRWSVGTWIQKIKLTLHSLFAAGGVRDAAVAK